MAVYKIFPYKDTSLYSFYPDMNTGIDPINQISNLNFAVDTYPQVSRFFLQFVSSEITDVIDNKIGANTWDVTLRSFIATAQGITEDTDLEIYPIGQTWNNGTGTYLDQPMTDDGATWNNSNYSGSGNWTESGSDGLNYISSSYNPTYSTQGGGNWYYSASDGTLFKVSQSFDTRSEKDLKKGVKTIVERWYSGSLSNYGFIIKWEDTVEFNTNIEIQPVMQFYSVDTTTIYPPQLEFKWRDYSSVLTGSATSSIVSTTNLVSSLAENPGTFFSESINRFRFNVAPKYPVRAWVTSSLFT